MPAEMSPTNFPRQPQPAQQNQAGGLNAYSTAELAAELRRRQPDDYRERYDWQTGYGTLEGIIAELERRAQLFAQWAGDCPGSDNPWEIAGRQTHNAAGILRRALENIDRGLAQFPPPDPVE